MKKKSRGKTLKVTEIREICRNILLQRPMREIARSLGHSPSLVIRYRLRLMLKQIDSLEQLESLSDDELTAVIYTNGAISLPYDVKYAKIIVPRPGRSNFYVPDFKELAIKADEQGYKAVLLWSDYLRECDKKQVKAMSRSSFYQRLKVELQKGRKISDNSYLIRSYRYGEELQVDHIGEKFTLNTPGGAVKAQIYTIVWPASNYAYACFVRTQSTYECCTAISNALLYFGVRPQVICCDNAKSYVINHRESEAELNELFEHNMALLEIRVNPAPYYSPQVKSVCEYTNRLILERVIPRMNGFLQQCHTFTEHGRKLQEAVEQYINAVPFRLNGEGTPRKVLFENKEKPLAKPLPDIMPQLAEKIIYKRLPRSYHIEINRHRYSAPYTLIGELITVEINQDTVNFYHNNRQVAKHLRQDNDGKITTVNEHMPLSHQAAAAKERVYATMDDVLQAALALDKTLHHLCKLKAEATPGPNTKKGCIAFINFYVAHAGEELAVKLALQELQNKPRSFWNLYTLRSLFAKVQEEKMRNNGRLAVQEELPLNTDKNGCFIREDQ